MKTDTVKRLRTVFVPAAFALAVILLLTLVNRLTQQRIETRNKAETRMAMQAVTPAEESEFVAAELSETVTAAAMEQGGKLTAGYRVTVAGDPAGYVFKVISGGTQSEIEMLVGVASDGTVSGVSVISDEDSATAGDSELGVLDQFRGMSGAGTLEVGKNILAPAGTETFTVGVTRGVNAALAAAAAMEA